MATSRLDRIKQAVADDEWQDFRRNMKGLPTEDKLARLKTYWNGLRAARTTVNPGIHGHVISVRDWAGKKFDVLHYDCDTCIRVDNYIKALCRGGQLYPGENLLTVLEAGWKPKIKS